MKNTLMWSLPFLRFRVVNCRRLNEKSSWKVKKNLSIGFFLFMCSPVMD